MRSCISHNLAYRTLLGMKRANVKRLEIASDMSISAWRDMA
jgi:hypothetical protein